MKKSEKGLTTLEQEVMKVLWDHDKDMTNSEIAACLKEQGISIASVAQVIKRLLEKGAVIVTNHVLVSNVYARSFRPSISRDQFIAEELERLRQSAFFNRKKGVKRMFVSLLQSDDGAGLDAKDIEELERLLAAKKAQFKKDK